MLLTRLNLVFVLVCHHHQLAVANRVSLHLSCHQRSNRWYTRRPVIPSRRLVTSPPGATRRHRHRTRKRSVTTTRTSHRQTSRCPRIARRCKVCLRRRSADGPLGSRSVSVSSTPCTSSTIPPFPSMPRRGSHARLSPRGPEGRETGVPAHACLSLHDGAKSL